jgi:hypothetical protein
MRMARLKTQKGELIISPNSVWVYSQGVEVKAADIGAAEGDIWILAISLEEALDELNAALRDENTVEVEIHGDTIENIKKADALNGRR